MTNTGNQTLKAENECLRHEISDLKLLLEAATGHSDGMEADLLEQVRRVLRESENKFRLIIEAIPLPILVTRPTDAAIRYANATSGELLGQSIETFLNRKVTDFYDIAELPALMDLIDRSGRIKGRELEIHDSHGAALWVETFVEKIMYGNEECLLIVLRDITERRFFEKQLQQSQKMEAIGTLAGGIAHDFNNILSGIIGYAEMARDLASENSKLYHYMSKLLTASGRAKDLVRQILTFSRQVEQELQPIQLKFILKEAMQFIRSSLPATISVKTEINSDAVVSADSTQLYQVLINLCANAADAMEEKGGILTVSLSNAKIGPDAVPVSPDLRPGDYVSVKITDTGSGISADVQKRIFDPFYTTKPVGEGTGLGLSVVHGIIKNHGGVIYLDSEPSKGTTFMIYLPISQPGKIKTPSQQNPKKQTGDARVLLIDDDPLIAEMTEEQLIDLGYDVTLVMDSHEALELFKSGPDRFDIVITDLTMPNMTGDKLGVELLKIRPDLPIILTSGSTTVKEEDILKLGIRSLLPKPFMQKDIADAIENALN